ncbi:hypothetical protein OG818_12055 [Streptomyces virginiae]|nr:hypothetical protein [Streptomyces virginiae]MCX4716534.1 hypothetical protein [Streptomyces virginiae]
MEKKANPHALAVALLTDLHEIHSREGSSSVVEDRVTRRARTTPVNRP